MIYNESVTSTLTLAHVGSKKVAFKEVNVDILTLSQQVQRVHPEGVESDLLLMSNATVATTKPATSPLSISQTTNRNIIYHRSVTSNLTLTQGVIVEAPIDRCDSSYYSPGSSLVRFTEPYVSPTSMVSIRRPEFGNSDCIDAGVVLTRTKVGQLALVRPSYRSTIEVLKVKFAAVPTVDKALLQTFLVATAGKEIGFLDHEARQWRGVVITAPKFNQESDDCGTWSIDLEFQGALA